LPDCLDFRQPVVNWDYLCVKNLSAQCIECWSCLCPMFQNHNENWEGCVPTQGVALTQARHLQCRHWASAAQRYPQVAHEICYHRYVFEI